MSSTPDVWDLNCRQESPEEELAYRRYSVQGSPPGTCVWAGAGVVGVGEICPDPVGAAGDNKRPLPPIVRESFVMPAAVSGKRAGMLCHAGGPAGRIQRQLRARLSWEPGELGARLFHLQHPCGAEPCSRPSGHEQRPEGTGPGFGGVGSVVAPRRGDMKPLKSFHYVCRSRVGRGVPFQ